MAIPSVLNVGDHFTMGSWGGEPIEWRALKVEGNRAYVISEYGLDRVQFNSSFDKGNDWYSSDLRAWLNDTLLPRAFSPSERRRISEVTCLSVSEAQTLFQNCKDRLCKPTTHTYEQGAYVNDSTGGCWWWLRSPGTLGFGYAAFVCAAGGDTTSGNGVDRMDVAVRPALWLNP